MPRPAIRRAPAAGKADADHGLSDAGLADGLPLFETPPMSVRAVGRPALAPACAGPEEMPPAASGESRPVASGKPRPVAPGAGEEAPPGHLGHRARMRQRLLSAGPDAVLDHELLEMVLFLALPRRDTKPLARALLARFGGFAGAIAAPPQELAAVEGLGEAGIAALKTVQAAALRLSRAEARGAATLDSWDRLVDYLTIHMARERVEQLRVLYLDTRNRLIADEVQGRGTVNHTPVYPREVVKRALELHATALILVHNHPSGDPTPSRADIDMTAEVRAAAGVFGILLHDHLIIGNGRHVSLRREGLL